MDKKIEIMAGFGQKHRREPVILKKATHKRMGHVVPGQILAVLDANHLAVGTRVDEGFHGAINRRQSHLVANNQDVGVILGCIVDANEILRVGAKGLFYQNMPSLIHGAGDEIESMVFQRGDHDPINLRGRVRKKLLGRGEAPIRFDAMRRSEGVALGGVRLHDGSESRAMWHFQGIAPENSRSAIPCSN